MHDDRGENTDCEQPLSRILQVFIVRNCGCGCGFHRSAAQEVIDSFNEHFTVVALLGPICDK